MASLSTDKRGNRRILFQGTGEPRQTIYLGKVPMDWAKEFLDHVERLVVWKVTRETMSLKTAGWLAELDAKFHAKLCEVGLASRRQADVDEDTNSPTVALEHYMQVTQKHHEAVAGPISAHFPTQQETAGPRTSMKKPAKKP